MFNVLENSIYLQDMHFPNKFSLVMKTSRGLLRIPKGPPFGHPDSLHAKQSKRKHGV